MPLSKPSFMADRSRSPPKMAKAAAVVAKKEGVGMHEAMMKVLLKGFLANDLAIRELMGATYQNFIIGKDNVIVQKITEALKDYHLKVSSEGKEHKRGPPFLWAWAALVEALLESQKTTQDIKDYLKKYWEEKMARLPPSELAGDIRACKLSKTFKKGNRKLRVANVDRELEKKVVLALKQNDANWTVGQPPKGELARQAEKLLKEAGYDAEKVRTGNPLDSSDDER
eukprot:TRINITY_DN44020_c0_g1_i1.p2 TRINITY_DN44020_c0_g1~~TRINITY_DN44020_c0_g1_i1.p2  ORF type:complete len:227 (-),score=87.30 TRINITY_DN44020_c0_g1_i1:251-931(-)